MSGKFMTSEGDRSGVDIPSKEDKAHMQIAAALGTLQALHENWESADKASRIAILATAQSQLAKALHQLASEK